MPLNQYRLPVIESLIKECIQAYQINELKTQSGNSKTFQE